MNKFWNNEELEFLTINYPIYGAQFCADKLGRTPMSIFKKASRLGLKSCNSQLRTHEEYEQELLDKEIDYYPLERYINTSTPILHECLEGHVWKVAPVSIIGSYRRGCPTCSASGFKPGISAILYYISITKDNETYYKLGITNHTVSQRFERDKDKTIVILAEKKFLKGHDARELEKSLLLKYSDQRVSVPGFLKSGGNSELFEYDIQPFQ